MIEVRVSYQDGIQRREILDSKAGTPQSFEKEEPGSEDGIDHDIRSGDLQKKRRVTNEGDSQLTLRGEHGTMGSTGALGHRRVSHQSAKLTGFLADTDVEHPTPLDAEYAVHDSISYSPERACNIGVAGI